MYTIYIFFSQYSAQDTSPLSNYVMHPFWNAVVKVSYEIGFAVLIIIKCYWKIPFFNIWYTSPLIFCNIKEVFRPTTSKKRAIKADFCFDSAESDLYTVCGLILHLIMFLLHYASQVCTIHILYETLMGIGTHIGCSLFRYDCVSCMCSIFTSSVTLT